MRKAIYFILSLFVLVSCNPPVNNQGNNKPIVKDVTLSVEKFAGGKEKGRDSWQKPGLILDKMGNIEGQKIADIGAYYGYFTLIMAHRGAKVIAVDIDPKMLKFIRETAESKSNPAFKTNIDYRLVKPENPSLRPNEVDQVLLVNMIGYLADMKDYFSKLKDGLKDGGQFNVVDFKMKRLPNDIDIPKDERMYADKVEDTLYDLGFKNIRVDDTSLDYQYIITAVK